MNVPAAVTTMPGIAGSQAQFREETVVRDGAGRAVQTQRIARWLARRKVRESAVVGGRDCARGRWLKLLRKRAGEAELMAGRAASADQDERIPVKRTDMPRRFVAHPRHLRVSSQRRRYDDPTRRPLTCSHKTAARCSGKVGYITRWLHQQDPARRGFRSGSALQN